MAVRTVKKLWWIIVDLWHGQSSPVTHVDLGRVNMSLRATSRYEDDECIHYYRQKMAVGRDAQDSGARHVRPTPIPFPLPQKKQVNR